MPLSICSFQTSQAAYQWSCEKIVRGGVESSCSLLGGEDEGASLSTMISNEDLLSAGILSGDAVTFTLTSRFVDGDKSSQDSLDVTFLGSSLEARLSGPSGLVEKEGELQFSAEDSSDPNDPQGQWGDSVAFTEDGLAFRQEQKCTLFIEQPFSPALVFPYFSNHQSELGSLKLSPDLARRTLHPS
eukprot:scaffold128592_cov17-Tisochrysis_lutea.AAC.1